MDARSHAVLIEESKRFAGVGDHGAALERHRCRLSCVDEGNADALARVTDDCVAAQAALVRELGGLSSVLHRENGPTRLFAGGVDAAEVERLFGELCIDEEPPSKFASHTASSRSLAGFRGPEVSAMPPTSTSGPRAEIGSAAVASGAAIPQAPPPPAAAPMHRNGALQNSIAKGPNVPAAAVGGFVTAQQQFQADVKAGKAAAPPPRPRQGLAPPATAVPPASGDAHVSMDAVARSVTGGKGGRKQPQGSRGGNPAGDSDDDDPASKLPESLLNPDGTVPEQLAKLDPKLVTQIASEILETRTNVSWDDVAGLEHAKAEVEEAIVWPLARPDLFSGIRDPTRGLLLFGPPGTGKTMIARAIAGRGSCTFMNVSSSSLMSKWIGDGEKMVRCMFAVAVVKQPTVIFIDEIDSLLSMRSEGEQDAVRRVKTEFLVHFDGVGSSSSDRILIVGATNRPEELDEAARRRMEKRLYIPLPDESARRILLQRLVTTVQHSLTPADFASIARRTDGYSGADIKQLARDASFGPLREQGRAIENVSAADIRPVSRKDFSSALKRVRPSVGPDEVTRYDEFNKLFGSFNGSGDGGPTQDGSSDTDAGSVVEVE